MFKRHLCEKLIPYWKTLLDERGGFYGEKNREGICDFNAIKGSIYTSRILWFLCNSYSLVKDESLIYSIEHCYNFIKNTLFDSENEGMAWSVSGDLSTLDNCKHTYNDAFAIYGLTNYYKIFPKEETLDIIYKLFNKIEKHKKPNGFYVEQFDECYNEVENRKLCEVEDYAPYTMNTMLHILEAYTDLFEITNDEKVKNAIICLIDTFKNVIYDKENKRLNVFFNENCNAVGDVYSYGHDIEASWLIDRAMAVAKIDDKEMKDIIIEIAYVIYDRAFINSSVINEKTSGIVHSERVWWIQAESMIGFINAYQNTKDEKFLKAVFSIWEYIQKNILKYNEWVWSVDQNGNDVGTEYIAGMWKAPYHNGRAMIELDKRLSNLQK